MIKYDVKTEHRRLYAPSTRDFELVEVPPLQYLAIDGHGDPNTAPEYADAVRALYPVAYALKFHSKRELGRDLVVAPLEGLWRSDDPGAFVRREKAAWSWTMLIHQPEWITAEHVADAVERSAAKASPASLSRLRLITLAEGSSAQIMHIGSYDDEGPTLRRLHEEWMPRHGLAFNGDHHEIYLGDPRRTAPERLRTVLRQPVRPIEEA